MSLLVRPELSRDEVGRSVCWEVAVGRRDGRLEMGGSFDSWGVEMGGWKM